MRWRRSSGSATTPFRYARPVPEDHRRVADLLVDCLENEGVTCVFGIPGEENIYLTDALSRSSSIRYVLVRHEQAASFMAEMFGRLTGRAGVCSATLGPGAINLLLGTADANTNSTPVVAFSAQVGLNRIYKESHQSVDLVSMFTPVTKWADTVLTPGAVPEMVRKAFKLAQTERPGAVYLAIPEDIESQSAPSGLAPLSINTPRPDEPSPSQIARAAAVLNGASRPIVLAGHGAARSGAAEALRRFSELLGLPVATTFHGKGVFADDHPHGLGAVGFMGHDYVNFGFDEADVVVSVGYELQEFDPVRINPEGDKRIIHVSRIPAEVDAHYDVEVGVQADISRTLDALASATTHRFELGASGEKIRRLLADELRSSPRERCPRWSERHSNWPRRNARARSTWPSRRTSRARARRAGWRPSVSTPLDPMSRHPRRLPVPPPCSTGPAVPSSWPGTARPAAVRPRPCGASPNCWASRLPRPFMAKGCSPTITRTPSAQWDSWVTTTSTSVSTRRTWSSASATSSRSSIRCGSTPTATSGSST